MKKSLKDLKGLLQDESIYIIGSGPSLNSLDINLLAGKNVVLVNGAISLLQKYKFFKKVIFATTDRRFLESDVHRAQKALFKTNSIFRLVRHDLHPIDEPELKDKTYYVKSLGRDGFSDDLDIGFYFGCTSIMLAVQAAYYADAKKVYLLGVDLSAIVGERRFYSEDNPQPVDAFYGVQVWNIANAAREFRKAGKEIVGVSETSFLRTYLPYKSFSEVIAE